MVPSHNHSFIPIIIITSGSRFSLFLSLTFFFILPPSHSLTHSILSFFLTILLFNVMQFQVQCNPFSEPELEASRNSYFSLFFPSPSSSYTVSKISLSFTLSSSSSKSGFPFIFLFFFHPPTDLFSILQSHTTHTLNNKSLPLFILHLLLLPFSSSFFNSFKLHVTVNMKTRNKRRRSYYSLSLSLSSLQHLSLTPFFRQTFNVDSFYFL